MKILQINATYGIGSTGVITKELSEICQQNGLDMYVAYSKGYGHSSDYSKFYEIGSWLDHKVHAILSRIAGKQAYFSHFATIRLLKFIDKVKPNVVHLHNLHSNYININILLSYLGRKNIKTVVTLHDCWFFTGGCFHYTSVKCNKWRLHCGNCIKQKLDTPALLYDASSKILQDRVNLFSKIKHLTFVGVSSWSAEQLKQSRLKNIGEVTYIHNGYDLDVFYPRKSDIRDRLGLKDKFIILGPASKWLLPINADTFSYFVKNMPKDTVLLLFGCDRSPVVSYPNVQYYGFINNRAEMAELYSSADVLVNCSREDTLSSINIEAQACGTPVITYNATGLKETVDNKCGFAVETGNHEILFSKMIEIYSNKKSCYKSMCHEFVAVNFEKASNYNKYIELYKTILND